MKTLEKKIRNMVWPLFLAVVMLFTVNTGMVSSAASAPDWGNDTYYGSGNPLTAGFKYQCTWYVWGRTRELLGIKLSANTKKYVDSSVTGGYTDTPSTNSIAVYMRDDGWIVHVAYIEYFDGTNVTYSEGNNGWKGAGDQKYFTDTMTLDSFTQNTMKWVAQGCTQLKYIPLDNGSVLPPSPIAVTTNDAQNVTETNATVYGHVDKAKGQNITSCGIYLGTSSDYMEKRNTESVGSAANNKGNGTGFDIWYDLTSELGIVLIPNTTYYYKIYCVCNGEEYAGNTKSFTTSGSAAPPVTVITGSAQNVTSTNARITGFASKNPGTAVSACGLYFGTDYYNLPKINYESVGRSANNHRNGTGFDIWYDLNSELGIYLSPGVTYYYRVYCICNGMEYWGDTMSFTAGW